MENNNYQSKTEKIIYDLRRLFGCHGYSHFNMSKFEEYEFYVNNKDFLVSDNVITFNDTDGRLLALKPDVTLSIVKNGIKEKGMVKLYYNENVYRVSPTSHNFKEIMQTGLECIGEIDSYSLCEVMLLACKSLDTVSQSSILDISHMGIISALIEESGSGVAASKRIIECISDKNIHELKAVFEEDGLDSKVLDVLCQLLSWDIDINTASNLLGEYAEKYESIKSAMNELETVFAFLGENGYSGSIKLDFSIVSDINYYSGIVFKGYVQSIPDSVLSGGRYDSLISKMGGGNKGALGFAVYLDGLDRLWKTNSGCDFDVFLKYDDSTHPSDVYAMIQRITALGKRVRAGKKIPEKLTFGEILDIGEGSVK